MADHGPESIPTRSNSAWKSRLKGYGKGNRPEDVRAEHEGIRKDFLESQRNVTPPQQFRKGGKVRSKKARTKAR